MAYDTTSLPARSAHEVSVVKVSLDEKYGALGTNDYCVILATKLAIRLT
jgi:hypothetical protein